MLISVMLIKKNIYIKQFGGFAKALGYHCRLCTWINKRGVWHKRRGWQNSSKLINGECRIRLGRVAKKVFLFLFRKNYLKKLSVYTLSGVRSNYWKLNLLHIYPFSANVLIYFNTFHYSKSRFCITLRHCIKHINSS